MKPHLIELYDPGLRVSNAEGALLESPGFASIAGKSPVFGQVARQQSRLHPRQTFNQFWAQLSLDPLNNDNQHFRHQADVAYGHLHTLARESELRNDILYAVPSHFSRNQLAVLLGLSRQCPFSTIGLADLGLLAAASAQSTESAVYLDLQLHQAVLTLVRWREGELHRERALQVPGAGLLALQDAWAGLITDAFVRQTRFNPLHNAETEQYLYNQLQPWLDAAMAGNEAMLEINYKGTVHQATVNRSGFEQRARSILQTISREIIALGGPDCQLLLTHQVSAMPGAALYLPPHDRIGDDAIAENAFRFLDIIRSEDQALKLVTRLPAPKKDISVQRRRGSAGRLCLLQGHRAREVQGEYTIVGKDQALSGPGMVIDASLPGPLVLENRAGTLILKDFPDTVRVNDAPVDRDQALRAGDRLGTEDAGFELLVIEVG